MFPKTVHCRQSRGERQGVDANLVGDHERIRRNVKGIRASLERLEAGRYPPYPNFHRDHRKAESAGRCLNLTPIQQGDRIADIDQNR